MQTQQFREKVYQSMRKRADSILDLIDALTIAGHVQSPVARKATIRPPERAIRSSKRRKTNKTELRPPHEDRFG
jgi:hypothetical protein